MLAFLVGCGQSSIDRPAAETPARPEVRPPSGLALDLAPIGATLELPPSSRPEGAPAPEAIPLVGRFSREPDGKGKNRGDVWKIRLPVGADLLPTTTRGTHTFGSAPPPGFAVVGPDGPLPFERNGRRPRSYGFDREWLYVGTEKGAPAPDPAAHTVTFARATAAEASLNLATSGLEPDTFVRRSFTVDGTTRRGLFLPAPATATFPVRVPPSGKLSFRLLLLPPAVVGEAESDGAALEVLVRAAGEETSLGEWAASTEPGGPIRVDLSAWSERSIELVLRSAPGGNATLDYLLVEDPALYTPTDHPRRTVLVFVDTTRVDHLGFMGYERNTTPVLDRWASRAAVFEKARSVAPWTLPSARAVLSGREPEAWYEAENLAEVFSAAGWRTDAVVANAFLSAPFDLDEGWASYRYEHLIEPPEIVAAGVAALEAEPDRDALLLVHFMGPHLPWDEPWTYQALWWAGSRPEELRADTRGAISAIGPTSKGFEEVREYVRGRYDQNLRWVDAELEDLLETAGPDATVALFSDHGEELWDHDGFEHGHTFYEELLHVPLVIKSPGLPEGRYDAPVSLLDVTPTLRELAGLAPAEGEASGRSLVPYAWGTDGAADALRDRKLAFGRPLYGVDGWGVVDHERKWWSRAGVQEAYDLTADPGEKDDLAAKADLEPWPDALSAALGRPVSRVWRVSLRAQTWPFPLELTISHPQGITRAWSGYDPRGRAAGTHPEVVDGRVTMHVRADAEAPDTLYLLPAGDPLDPTGLALTLVGRQVMVGGTAAEGRIEPAERSRPFLAAGDPRFGASVVLDVVPEPAGVEVGGFHPELEQQLQELGYLDP